MAEAGPEARRPASSVFGLLHRAPLSGGREVLAATLGSSRLLPGTGLALFSLFLGLSWMKRLLIVSRLSSQPEELRQGQREKGNGEKGPGH